jgi:hypothetical protein
MKMNVERKLRQGRSKIRWLDTIENYMRAVVVCVGDVEDRHEWRFGTRGADPKYLKLRRRKKRRLIMYYINNSGKFL